MSADVAAAAGQRAARALMRDACTITRATGTRVWDPDAGTYTQATTTVYTGACRVRPRAVTDRTAQQGEEAVTVWRHTVSVPLTVDPELDDVVTVNASADASLVGRALRVTAVTRGTHITARRMECEEREAP